MPSYVYELPTTGEFSFSGSCTDPTNSYVVDLANATSARANLRTVLKESKRSDGEKDSLRILKTVEDYLPYLYSLIDCVREEEIGFKVDPFFSWRSTLSNQIINSSPRRLIPSLHGDLIFTLLTYAFTLSNLSVSVVASLGTFEIEKTLTEPERKTKDDRLKFAADLLCRASGIFSHIAEVVIPEWEQGYQFTKDRPPELTKEAVNGLSRLTLADAQVLSIRKLMTKAAYDVAQRPGPPLPKSHPSPILIAKIYLNISSLYSSARSLVKTSGGSTAASTSGSSEVNNEIRTYLADETTITTVLAHKWLGVDAGAHDSKVGEAVGFLRWAKEELEGMKEGKLRLSSMGKSSSKDKSAKKGRLHEELDAVKIFLSHYQNLNDTVFFLPVLPTAALQSLVPAGRAVLAPKPYEVVTPMFGPRSVEGLRQQTENLETLDDQSTKPEQEPKSIYSGAGAYY